MKHLLVAFRKHQVMGEGLILGVDFDDLIPLQPRG